MLINNTQEIITPGNKWTLTVAHCTKPFRNDPGSLHTCLTWLYLLCSCSGPNPAVVHQTQILSTLLSLSWEWKTGACRPYLFWFFLQQNIKLHMTRTVFSSGALSIRKTWTYLSGPRGGP